MPSHSPRETCRRGFPRLTWSEPRLSMDGDDTIVLVGECAAFGLSVYVHADWAAVAVELDCGCTLEPQIQRTTLGRALYAARLAIRKQATAMLAFSEV